MIFSGRYQQRLARDLVRWQQLDWISEQGRQRILQDVAGSRGVRLGTALALLGALLSSVLWPGSVAVLVAVLDSGDAAIKGLRLE